MTASKLFLVVILGFFAPQVAAGDDEPDELLPGRIVAIKPASLVKFVAKPPSGSSFALPGALNDPTTEGGILQVFDTTAGAGDDVYVLSVQPAPLGWSGLGSPPGAKGFKYRGAGTAGDPCKVVIVKPSVVKAVCKGDGIALAPPFAGDVGVVLTLGTDSKSYCARFGGTDAKNDATALKRKAATAPLACPEPPVVGPPPGSIFVDTVSGSDGNAGTMLAPKKTIQAGIAAAGLGGGDVFISKGSYSETITLLDGVSLFGGYDSSDGWSHSPANVVTISGGTTALLGTSITTATELSDLTIQSANAAAGDSSYGVYLTSSTAVALTGVSIAAGTGGAGAAGGSESPEANGVPGGDGNPGCENGGPFCGECSAPEVGTAGTSICGRSGGEGGAAGLGNSGGGIGETGTGATPGGPGGMASGDDGTVGSNGASGSDGTDGSGGAAFGTALAAGYLPAAGSNGGGGTDGNGGGGGGGGGGGVDACDSYGSSGGGGGGGGCGGAGADGGGGGGGSFGIYLHGSTIAITGSSVQTSGGGSGGSGGAGGSGGTGALGGDGGLYGGSDEQDDGGNGADGGRGGDGGDGGDGGGGGGGPSVAISCAGASSLSVNSGNTMTPGAGGSGGSSPGNTGSTGTSAATLGCP